MDGAAADIETSLVGKLLITPPDAGDPRFDLALTLIVEHSEEGALGIVINQPSLTPIEEIAGEWVDYYAHPKVIFGGGPVDHDALIALGRGSEPNGPFALGAFPVDLNRQPAFLQAEGVEEIRIFSGYAGWVTGQLEEEIRLAYWWMTEATLDDLFTDDPAGLWSKVLMRAGSPLHWYAHYPVDVRSN